MALLNRVNLIFSLGELIAVILYELHIRAEMIDVSRIWGANVNDLWFKVPAFEQFAHTF